MRSIARALVACTGLAAAATLAHAGPDVVVSTIGPTLTRYGTAGGITGYATTTVSCNIGDAIAIWIDSTSTSNPQRNQHPVIGQQLYRLHNGRFEQIGMSWLKHGFCAADAPSCTSLVPGSTYQPNGSCDWLGLFATDTYSASLNGQQGNLGPRSEINAVNGAFPYPYLLQWNQTGNCIYKRLQVANADLDPANYPGARFFMEVHYIPTDEAAADRYNNASYREVAVTGQASSGSGCTSDGMGFTLAYPTNQATIPLQPAIMAWATIDPTVSLVAVDIPNDGRIIVGSKVTNNNNGTWSYEYAVYNHNSDRSVGGFFIPKSSAPEATFSNVGFHDVAYHSGEPYSGNDWLGVVTPSNIRWECDPYERNVNGNAIRWSTTYNFRFTSNRPPQADGTVTLNLFKPGLPGDPNSVAVNGVPVPSVPTCPADFDGNGIQTVQDVFSFLGAWFANDAAADFNDDTMVTIDDLFGFVGAYFAGC